MNTPQKDVLSYEEAFAKLGKFIQETKKSEEPLATQQLVDVEKCTLPTNNCSSCKTPCR